ncbi:MAG: hypothetical protein GEU82_05790 [Luteitalea sp.]|nr:hypothetical protein [Luteitalea sp.]
MHIPYCKPKELGVLGAPYWLGLSVQRYRGVETPISNAGAGRGETRTRHTSSTSLPGGEIGEPLSAL